MTLRSLLPLIFCALPLAMAGEERPQWSAYYQHWDANESVPHHDYQLKAPPHYRLITQRDGYLCTASPNEYLRVYPNNFLKFDGNYTIESPVPSQGDAQKGKLAFYTAWSKSDIMPLELKEDKIYRDDQDIRIEYKQAQATQANAHFSSVGELVVSTTKGAPSKEFFCMEFLDAAQNIIPSEQAPHWYLKQGEESILRYSIPTEDAPAFFRIIWAVDKTEISIPEPPPTTAARLNSPITLHDEDAIAGVSTTSLSYFKDRCTVNFQIGLNSGWELIGDEQPQQLKEGISLQAEPLSLLGMMNAFQSISVHCHVLPQDGRLIIKEPITLKFRHKGEEQERSIPLSLDITLPVINF